MTAQNTLLLCCYAVVVVAAAAGTARNVVSVVRPRPQPSRLDLEGHAWTLVLWLSAIRIELNALSVNTLGTNFYRIMSRFIIATIFAALSGGK